MPKSCVNYVPKYVSVVPKNVRDTTMTIVLTVLLPAANVQ
jgi:hypothetical protein